MKEEAVHTLETLKKRFIGKRVLIVGNHPHTTKTGTVDRLEYVDVVGKYGFVVNFDDGLSGFVFDAKNWVVL